MSKYFSTRLTQGYAGTRSTATLAKYQREHKTCALPWCTRHKSKYLGHGKSLCEQHQAMLREYGGPARLDRHWTFNKHSSCDCCGFDPWQQAHIQKISDPLIRDRVAWGMLIVDHIHTQQAGGSDHPANCQTLCLICNQLKTALSADTMPACRYNDCSQLEEIRAKLRPFYTAIFG